MFFSMHYSNFTVGSGFVGSTVNEENTSNWNMDPNFYGKTAAIGFLTAVCRGIHLTWDFLNS